MLSTQSSIQGKGNESNTATAFNSTQSVQNCEEPSDFGANKQEELLTLYCRSGLNQIRCSLLHYFLPHCLMLLQTLRPSSSTVQPNQTQGTDAAATLRTISRHSPWSEKTVHIKVNRNWFPALVYGSGAGGTCSTSTI